MKQQEANKPDEASRLVRKIFPHVELLMEHPELVPGIPELRPASCYRQLVENPRRIF